MACSTTANIVIKAENGENVGRYYCPHTAMQELFKTISSANGYNIDKNVSNLSANLMEDTLLNVNKMTFHVLDEQKLIKCIDLLA